MSDARRESVARLVQWIEEKGIFGALREEEVEKEVYKAGPEYGWIDEDGLDFNNDEEIEEVGEEEVKQAEDLTDLLVLKQGHKPGHRIGMIVPQGQNLRIRAERIRTRFKVFEVAYDTVFEGDELEADLELVSLLETSKENS